MASGSKKKGKPKGKTLNLNEWLQKEDGTVPAPVSTSSSWAAEMDNVDDDGDDSRPTFDRSQLPTAPKAARGPNVDMSLIPDRPPYTAFVGNLPYDAQETDIQEYFEGRNLGVANVRLPNDGGRQRGFGYVEFATKEDLVNALGYNDETVFGRKIRVDLASGGTDRERGGDSGRSDRDDWRGGGDPNRTEGDWRRRDPPAFSNDDRGGYGDRGGDRDGGFSRGNNYSDRGGGFSDRGGDRYGDRDGYGDRRSSDRGFSGGYNDRSGGRYSSDRDRYGGFDDRRGGGFDDRRGGGFDDRRGGGFDDRRGGGFDDRRGGGFDDRRGGGFDDRRGGGFDDRRGGGYDRRGGGYDRDNDDRRDGYGSRSRGYGRDGGYRRDDYGRSGYGSRDDRYDQTGSRDGSQEPKERPRLQLQPRTKPVEKAPAEQGRQSSIFGSAKPVDTAAKEREIEEKMKKLDTASHFTSEEKENYPRESYREGGRTRRDSDRSDGGRSTGRERRLSNSSGKTGGSRRDSETSRTSEDSHPPEKEAKPSAKMVPAPPPKENAWSRPRGDAGGRPERQLSSSSTGSQEDRYQNASRQNDRRSDEGRRGGYGKMNSGGRQEDRRNDRRDETSSHKRASREKHLPKSIEDMPKLEQGPGKDWSDTNKFAAFQNEAGSDGD